MDDPNSPAANTVLTTGRREQFCQEYVKHSNATEAYFVASGKVHNKNYAANYASRLLKQPPIQERIAEIRRSMQLPAEQATSVKQGLIARLTRVANKAEALDKFGDVIKAVDVHAKLEGLYSQEETDGSQYLQFFDKVSITITPPAAPPPQVVDAQRVIENE